MDDYARMANIEPIGPYNVLKQFIEEQSKLNAHQKYFDLEIIDD